MPAPTQTMRNLNELLAASTRAADQAQAMIETAEEENNREFTADEEILFQSFLAESKTLREQYEEELAADQRAARRALLEDTRQGIAQVPSAMNLVRGSIGRVSQVFDRMLLDPKRGFAHIGDFALKVYDAFNPGGGMPDERLLKIAAASTGMNQAQGSQGGYLVPPEFSTKLWDGMNMMPDNLMKMCDQYTVTGESLTFPANAETSRATGSRYGGVRGYWIAEATQITSSIPTVRRMKLEPQELAVLVYVTDKLLNNAVAIEQYLRRAATEEIMFLVNDSIINGNGVGQPVGVINSTATITISAETGQTADTIVVENINKMYARMHARARSKGVWFINQDVEPQLEQLSAAVGTGGVPVYLAMPQGFPNIAEAPQKRLKGLPVMPIEYCDTLGNKGDIILANLGYYALGVRGGVSEDMSMHLRFDFAETAFRFMFAVDGQSWLNSAITPFKGTNTLSQFLVLAAR